MFGLKVIIKTQKQILISAYYKRYNIEENNDFQYQFITNLIQMKLWRCECKIKNIF